MRRRPSPLRPKKTTWWPGASQDDHPAFSICAQQPVPPALSILAEVRQRDSHRAAGRGRKVAGPAPNGMFRGGLTIILRCATNYAPGAEGRVWAAMDE